MVDKKKLEDYEQNDHTMPTELVEAMLSISDMTDNIVRAVPEHTFRTKYLPLFVNTTGKVDLSKWLDVSGTAYESVNVVKDGRVLFVVPPLVKRHPTLINVDSRFSASTIVAESIQHHSRHPALGMSHLMNNLGGKVLKEGVNLEEVKQWNMILQYYGYPIIGGAKVEPNTLSPAQAEFDDDDFEEA